MRTRPSDLHVPLRDYRLNWTHAYLLNSWANYADATWCGAGFAVDEVGWVVLRGLVTNPTSIGGTSPLFVLPSGLRPGMWEMFGCWAFPAPAFASVNRLDIYADGRVAYVPVYGGAVNFLSLDGVRFRPGGGYEAY